MLVVPLQALAAQQVNVTLGGQACTIQVAQKTTGMFLNLYVNNILVIGGVICEVGNRIVRSAYLGFIGDIGFIDTQAASDPVDLVEYTGIGTRFFLVYIP